MIPYGLPLIYSTVACDAAPSVRLLLLVGIELGRAGLQVEGYRPRPFGCEVGSQFHRGHVSRGPPIMPDGQISRVRFEALACLPWAFPAWRGLSAGSQSPRLPRFAHSLVPLPRQLCASSVSDRRAA